MSIPGFTAEASVGKVSGHYNMVMTSESAPRQVIPQDCIEDCWTAYHDDVNFCFLYELPGTLDNCLMRARLNAGRQGIQCEICALADTTSGQILAKRIF
jgi:hypothetical protein